VASTLPQLKQPHDLAMQAQARPGVPPDKVEVEVEIDIDIGWCEKEEQKSELGINVGEICAGIVNGARQQDLNSLK
jgi:hypothetical protein